MGMSASQARLLSITSRMNDIEYKSQQISNVKVRLADESEQVSKAYTSALNKSQLSIKTYDQNGAHNNVVDGKSLVSGVAREMGYELVKFDGSKPNFTSEELGKLKSTQIYEMIESGQYILRRTVKDTETNKVDVVNVSVSSDTNLEILANDKTAIAIAEADYNAATTRINRKEKQLDQEIKRLDTEHNALKTEQDSVKTLIGNNVEKTFNLFA